MEKDLLQFPLLHYFFTPLWQVEHRRVILLKVNRSVGGGGKRTSRYGIEGLEAEAVLPLRQRAGVLLGRDTREVAKLEERAYVHVGKHHGLTGQQIDVPKTAYERQRGCQRGVARAAFQGKREPDVVCRFHQVGHQQLELYLGFARYGIFRQAKAVGWYQKGIDADGVLLLGDSQRGQHKKQRQYPMLKGNISFHK
ncbi:MAG: hypothetical protein Q4G63_10585 [Bacteroidia bacterium]|nr:hypothetical protein [Bacteroidia bacterium]